MATRTIIEIDDRNVRVARTASDGRRVHLSKVFSFEFDATADSKANGLKLREQLHRHGFGRGEADLILNRRSIEMREISLPPAPDAELPDLLKFSARNEFASVNDSWRVDFVPLTNDPAQKRIVLAGALSPQLLGEVTTIFETAGLRLARILMRPFCVTQALPPSDADKSILIVHEVGDSLDLTLVRNRQVVMTRSVMLPEAAAEARQSQIALEASRAAMMSSRTGAEQHVNVILLICARENAAGLKSALEAKRIGSIRVIEAGNEVAIRGGSINHKHPELFLAHFGAAQSLQHGGTAIFDFVNPRRRVERKRDLRRIVLWGGVAAIVLISCAIGAWMMLTSQTRTMARLSAELAELKKSNESSGNRPGVDQIIDEVQLVDTWQRNNINWLNEIKEISGRMLTADDAIVSSFIGDLGREGPEIKIRGRTTQRETNTMIKNQLANRPYQIDERRSQRTGESVDYPYEFDYTLRMDLSSTNVADEIAQRIREAPTKTAGENAAEKPAEKPTENPKPKIEGESSGDESATQDTSGSND